MVHRTVAILLLAGLFSAHAGPVDKLKRLRPAGRIVGGYETLIEQHPWQVSMQIFGIHECGGVIISPDAIVTAAHCMEGLLGFFYEVVAGTTDLLSKDLTRVGIRHTDVHPQYDGLDYDFAIVWLKESLVFDDKIQAIKIAEVESNIGDLVTVSGWGLTSEIALLTPNILRAVDINVVGRQECAHVYADFDEAYVTARMVCAGATAGGKDSCGGDSGGPLTNTRNELLGLVSWGYGCGEKGYPGVYSNVVSVRDWIRTTAKL